MKTVAFIRGTGIYDDSRSTKEIFALAEAGYTVFVLGWNREGEALERCQKVFEPIKDRVQLHFYNKHVENGLGFKNIDKLIGWINWIGSTLKKIEKLNIVHACDLDAGIAAYMFCKKNNVAFVYDIFDYYIDTHSVPRFLSDLVEGLEIKVINFSSATIICTEERREQISKSNPQRIVVIHNSPEVDNLPCETEDIDYFYCGSLGGERLIEEIFDEYENKSNFSMKFGGYGSYSIKAKELMKKYNKFEFLGIMEYSEVLKYEARAKVLAAIYEPTKRNHQFCAPNKFYESLALGKPVIVCKGTGIDKIVEKNNIGCVIDYDVKQFYKALCGLVENPELRAEMGKRARWLYEEQYSWSAIKNNLLELYASL